MLILSNKKKELQSASLIRPIFKFSPVSSVFAPFDLKKFYSKTIDFYPLIIINIRYVYNIKILY